jgi:hypothetical protein
MHPDFFLWRFLKERVYGRNPRSLEDLKCNIEQALAGTYQLILQKVGGIKTLKGVNAHFQEGVEHFKHLF